MTMTVSPPHGSTAVRALLDDPRCREVGTGRTEMERRVEEVIAACPGWDGARAWYAPVTGGLQNSNWQVSVEGDPVTYFLKIPGAGSEEYVDRALTSAVGQKAGALGIGPRVVHFDAASGVEVVEYLEGYRACTNGDLKDAKNVGAVLDIYRTLHGAEPFGTVKTVFDMIDEHLDQVRALGVDLPRSWAGIQVEEQAARSALTGSGLDIVPCHNDPMPGNFLIAAGRPMRIVDYEFASDNDRTYELGLLAAEMFFDDERVTWLVEQYFGTVDRSRLARVHVGMALADVKWGLWGCMYSALNRSWDFDYYKYGSWKLARARAKMADPRWGSWLSLL